MPFPKAYAAKLVMRTIKVPVLSKDKKTHERDPVTQMPLYKDAEESIDAGDVLDFALDDHKLTVVTTSGEKLTAILTDDDLKKAPAE